MVVGFAGIRRCVPVQDPAPPVPDQDPFPQSQCKCQSNCPCQRARASGSSSTCAFASGHKFFCKNTHLEPFLFKRTQKPNGTHALKRIKPNRHTNAESARLMVSFSLLDFALLFCALLFLSPFSFSTAFFSLLSFCSVIFCTAFPQRESCE